MIDVPSITRNPRGERETTGYTALPNIYVLEVTPRQDPEGEPLAHLLIERKEEYKKRCDTGKVIEAKFSLYWSLLCERDKRHGAYRKSGDLQGGYSGICGWLSLTSHLGASGIFFLDLPGLEGNRIGTYLFNQVVLWAKQWPEVSVNSIRLNRNQGKDPDNKERRNRLYEQFNLSFEYTDETRESGHSVKIPAGELTSVDTWKSNIREVGLSEFMIDLMSSRERALFEHKIILGEHKQKSMELQEIYAKPFRELIRIKWRQFIKCDLPIYFFVAAISVMLFLSYALEKS